MLWLSSKDKEFIKGFILNKIEDLDFTNLCFVSMSVETARSRKRKQNLKIRQ